MSRVSQDAERVAAAFAERRAANGAKLRHSCLWVDRTPDTPNCTYRIFTDGVTIWSYGSHFPIARHEPNGTVTVTNARYKTGTWKSGKPKYGPTTDKHIQETRDALERAGYRDTGTINTDGCSVYVKLPEETNMLIKRPCRYCGLLVLTLRRRPVCRHCAADGYPTH